MPPVAIAVASAAASSYVGGSLTVFAWGSFNLGSGALGSALAGGLAGFSVSRIGGALLGQTNKKRSGGSFSTANNGIKQIIRLSDDTWKIIYGRARIGGTLALASSSNNGIGSDGVSVSGDNLFLHLVIIHACHEIDAVEEIYINDTLVTLDSNGFVQEEPFYKGGKSYIRIKHHLGGVDQTADSDLISEVEGIDSNFRLQNRAYSYMRLQWDNEIFQSGLPTLNVVVRGKKVYDPRNEDEDYGSVAVAADEFDDFGGVADAATYSIDFGSVAEASSTFKWSDNAALCIADYLTSRDSQNIPYGFGATSDEIDHTFTIAAANICDELIIKTDATAIPRYTINGVVDSEKTPIDNLENMLTALAGAVTYPKGKFRIYAGSYDTPEADIIDETWLSGDMEVVHRISKQDLFNAVKGKFINTEKGWQADDFPELTSADYEAQDNGERIFTDIELPYTIDAERAQRIAKITQRKGREQISVSMQCNPEALKFTVWDTVKINNTKRGWNEKVFRIISFSYDLLGGVKLELREENSASYDWSVSDAQAIANAPDTNLTNPFTVTIPEAVAYSSRAVDTVSGDQIYNLVMTWEEHSNAFVRSGGQFEIQFKLSADSSWRPSFFVDGSLTTSDIVSSSINTSYDLRIRAINTLGAKSNWVEIDNAIIGSSGGVGSTEDWGEWVSSPSTTDDFGDWTSTPSTTDDWGYYT